MSNEETNNELKELLKQSVPSVQNAELRRDLWPQVLRKLGEQPAPAIHVPWFDWALAAILSAILIFFPGSIPVLFYHL